MGADAGVAAALCGAGILLFERGFHLVEGSEGWGNALVLIAVLSIAANTVIIKLQLQRFGTLWVMGGIISSAWRSPSPFSRIISI